MFGNRVYLSNSVVGKDITDSPSVLPATRSCSRKYLLLLLLDLRGQFDHLLLKLSVLGIEVDLLSLNRRTEGGPEEETRVDRLVLLLVQQNERPVQLVVQSCRLEELRKLRPDRFLCLPLRCERWRYL